MRRTATHKTVVIGKSIMRVQVRKKGYIKGRKGRNGYGMRVILCES